MADTGKRGVDVAIDCAALGPSMNQCLHVVRNAGRRRDKRQSPPKLSPAAVHVMRRKRGVAI